MGKLKTLLAVLEETRAALEEARMRANLLAAEMGDIREECSEAGITEPQDETPTLRMVQALIEDANKREREFAAFLGHEDVDEGMDEVTKLLGIRPEESLISAFMARLSETKEVQFRHLVNAFFPETPPTLEVANKLRQGLRLDPWTTVPPEW